MAEKMRNELQDLPKNYLVLITSSPEKYVKTTYAILRVLLNEIGLTGVYISVNRPYFTLLERLKERGIKTDDLYLIDCASGLTGKSPGKTGQCYILSGPSNLTDLGMCISELLASQSIKGREENCFLFLDSVSTFLIYNDPAMVARFLHLITSRAREHKLKGAIFSLRKDVEDIGVIAAIAQFCDKVIHVNG
ncbi:MAG: hypothetical protein ACE5Z5_14180 [Candidatus Bathyarchaeia archaeon]